MGDIVNVGLLWLFGGCVQIVYLTTSRPRAMYCLVLSCLVLSCLVLSCVLANTPMESNGRGWDVSYIYSPIPTDFRA